VVTAAVVVAVVVVVVVVVMMLMSPANWDGSRSGLGRGQRFAILVGGTGLSVAFFGLRFVLVLVLVLVLVIVILIVLVVMTASTPVSMSVAMAVSVSMRMTMTMRTSLLVRSKHPHLIAVLQYVISEVPKYSLDSTHFPSALLFRRSAPPPPL
jgi:hypothetical protein